ncbi:MAG: TonB-dependent receptor [Pseudomonadota bacterium]
MKIRDLMSATALAGAAIILAPSAAHAQNASQDDDAQTDQAAADANRGTIVVTGTRIANPNVSSPVPVTSVSALELTDSGNVSLGDSLNQLPALRSTFSQSNSTRFIGTAGLNLLDLRGLGTVRTLVLVNGRRHITSSPGDFRVDINTIPTDLVERVDVVTGGNSAIYGADAVAGVVNFVLRRDFDGIRLRAQSGISDEGDRQSEFISLTAGQNFSEGRGNVAIALEYADADPLFNSDRDSLTGAFSGRNQFQLVQNRAGEPSTGDGIPDRNFIRGVRNNNISDGGLYTSTCPAAVPAGDPTFAAVQARRAVNCTGLIGPDGSELGRTFVFNNIGQLVANPIVTDFRPFGSGNALGGLGSTLRDTGMLQAGLERYAINLLASYEVAEAFRPFLEAKYVRIDALQEGQPTFNFNAFSLDNPFLTPESRALLVSSLSPAAVAAPAGTPVFGAFRFNTDFGGRGEEHRRETWRVVAGVDGQFNDDWQYEVAFNYGRLETFYETNGNVLNVEYANAINAVRSGGQIVCGINADADPTNDDPACVPVNLFGPGQVSQEALNYFGFTSSREEEAEQYGVTAYVAGDLSQLFELPGGPIGFVIGGEYRRETAFSAFDDVTASGATFLNAIADFDPPALEVWEAYGEINFPILSGMRFAEELSLQAAGRISDFNSEVGTVYAYNLSAVYAPIRDIRFRVGYAQSVRTPTLSDQFSAGSQTFANGLNDPCSSDNIANNPNRAANCAADPNVPAFNPDGVTPFRNQPASGVRGINGGNPNVTEETGESWTAGVVFQPSFLPGFTLSVDYYDITVEDVIFTLTGQTIINQCYDNPGGIDNPFCDAINRRPDGTFAGQSDRILNGVSISLPVGANDSSFLAGPFNFARLETSGIDFDANYNTEIFGGVDLNMRLLVSYLIDRTQFTDITQPDFPDRVKGELGDPEWSGTFSADLDFGAFDFSYRLTYIGKQAIATEFEDQNAFNGEPARDPDGYPLVWYPDVFYHNFRIGLDVGEQFRFYAGVDNAFDRQPPFGLLGTEGRNSGGAGVFNNIGRFFYAGAEVRF